MIAVGNLVLNSDLSKKIQKIVGPRTEFVEHFTRSFAKKHDQIEN